MPNTPKPPPILICDENAHARRLVAEVLMGAGFERIHFAFDGPDLLKATVQVQPRIVITSSRIPGISGLHYTRMVRDGYEGIDRALSVIVMTTTPTEAFLEAARESGVDEMLRRPFTGAALLARVEAVLLRPRRFVESVVYVGPCRRRRMLEDYGGPLRRFSDPFENAHQPLWEAEGNRELVRQCLDGICDLAAGLEPSDRRRLRDLYAAVGDAEQLADEVCDLALGDCARSLGRYLGGVGATGRFDLEVLRTHLDAMQQLSRLGSELQGERDDLVHGLAAVVDKRLGRSGPGRTQAA